MKKLLLIAAASATILSSTLSFADCAMDTNQAQTQNENKWYLKANAGATIFDKTKDKTSTPNLKMKSNTSFIGEVGAGYYIMDNLRADLTLGMVSNAQFKNKGTDGNLYSYSVKIKPTITTLLVNGYVDFVDVGMFKVFGGAGIGTSLIKEKRTVTLQNRQELASYTESVSTKKTYNFAYQVSLGASAEVAEGVKAELVYSYRDYGKTKTKKIVNSDGHTFTYGGTRYKGNNLMAGIRFDI